MSDELQIIGLCRFSYPTAEGSGFRLENAAEAEVPAIYDPARLRQRLWLFEHICLPGVSGQIDKDFTLILLVGARLPHVIRHRLDEMIAPHPQIQLRVENEHQHHDDVCAGAFHSTRRRDTQLVAEFALDDDDCVSVTFIAEIRRILRQAGDLAMAEGRFEIDFPRGFALLLDDKGLALKQVVNPHWNCGQVIVQSPSSRLSLFNFHHYRFWKRHTCLSFARETMFIRSYHGFNDSGNKWHKLAENPGPMADAELALLLQERFGIDLAATKASLALASAA